MKHAKILHAGRAVSVQLVEGDTKILLADGQVIPVENACWLPPITSGASVFALGLNYADHTKELGFKKQEIPLVFLKGSKTMVGHNGVSVRPNDAHQMHPECELVAIIGKPAKKVSQADAMSYVGGYTIACDYAIREYLENFYRPNLRVKNRDGVTPLGPWVVDAADIEDPHNLALSTTVNGVEVQSGNTSDMVFNIAALIEYLSGFMTLMPGDMILTGTPHGVHFVSSGDVVECKIEKIGQLTNHIGSEV